MATTLILEKVSGFNTYCLTLMCNPEFVEAMALFNQAKDVLAVAFSELNEKVESKGKELFTNELQSFAAVLWRDSDQEWNRKRENLEDAVKKLGYRERVARHHKQWFDNDRRVELEQQIYDLVVADWQLALDKVSELLETEQEEAKMMTQHAAIRAQQRCIPPLIDQWLDQFGEELYDVQPCLLVISTLTKLLERYNPCDYYWTSH